ncbi:MAG: metallophosphoesterase, partial [Saprospiraceae bacterium]|nr:metallophosphoesterase [Saprospiraceae bacterium]
MQLLFFTDLHTGNVGEYPHHVDLRKNFTDLLREISQHHFDYLIIGGDLCLQSGDVAIYQWQKEQLDALKKPYFIIAGNHDNQLLLCEVFEACVLAGNEEIYFSKIWDGIPVLFLDTGRGSMSGQQKEWLRTTLKGAVDTPVVIFMHHPPLLMQVPHMDRQYALEDREEIQSILQETPNPKHIFCGHYHVEKNAFQGNVSVTVTPSLFFQIEQFNSDFAIDHFNIAYRS